MFEIGSAGEGDYDEIAISGMSAAFPRTDGKIQLARTGPFVPPLSVTFDNLIATTAMRFRLENSRFDDWSILPVIKYQIVRSRWIGEGPPPKTLGDPEDFILDTPNDEECAAEMAELWEIVPPVKGSASSVGNRDDESLELYGASVAGGDLFRIQLPGGHLTACSAGFRSWLETMDDVRKWVKFTSIQLKSQPKKTGDENGRDILDDFLKRFADRSENHA